MKKIIAVLVLAVMSLTMIEAQAEMKLRSSGYEMIDGETKTYVVLESESGESVKLFVTQEEQDKYVQEKLFKDLTENDAETNNWFGNTVTKIGTFVTFWN